MKIHNFLILLTLLLCIGNLLSAQDNLLSAQEWTKPENWVNLSYEDLQNALSAGIDINARDENGTTPLMAASGNTQNPDVITVLINVGADINARDENGSTPLMAAARNNQNPDVITTLINAGADINAQNKHRWTALMEAARYNENPEIITTLLNAGANVTMGTLYPRKTAWDLIQENDALQGTDVYWELNRRRF
ncbi:MAG: ankyrin repeat domain-containing protein [Salinispira sp.]